MVPDLWEKCKGTPETSWACGGKPLGKVVTPTNFVPSESGLATQPVRAAVDRGRGEQ
jgi:hypothetical protein